MHELSGAERLTGRQKSFFAAAGFREGDKVVFTYGTASQDVVLISEYL